MQIIYHEKDEKFLIPGDLYKLYNVDGIPSMLYPIDFSTGGKSVKVYDIIVIYLGTFFYQERYFPKLLYKNRILFLGRNCVDKRIWENVNQQRQSSQPSTPKVLLC